MVSPSHQAIGHRLGVHPFGVPQQLLAQHLLGLLEVKFVMFRRYTCSSCTSIGPGSGASTVQVDADRFGRGYRFRRSPQSTGHGASDTPLHEGQPHSLGQWPFHSFRPRSLLNGYLPPAGGIGFTAVASAGTAGVHGEYHRTDSEQARTGSGSADRRLYGRITPMLPLQPLSVFEGVLS